MSDVTKESASNQELAARVEHLERCVKALMPTTGPGVDHLLRHDEPTIGAYAASRPQWEERKALLDELVTEPFNEKVREHQARMAADANERRASEDRERARVLREKREQLALVGKDLPAELLGMTSEIEVLEAIHEARAQGPVVMVVRAVRRAHVGGTDQTGIGGLFAREMQAVAAADADESKRGRVIGWGRGTDDGFHEQWRFAGFTAQEAHDVIFRTDLLASTDTNQSVQETRARLGKLVQAPGVGQFWCVFVAGTAESIRVLALAPSSER